MTTDPIQAAMEALDAIQNGVLWGGISKQVRDEFSQEIFTIRDALKQLRAHQSEVAAKKISKIGVGEWIEHTSFNGCPKEIRGKEIEIKYRDGKTVVQTAHNGPDWYFDCGNEDYDIVAYRHAATIKAAGGE